MIKVGLGLEVHRQRRLGVGPECFAQMLVIVSQEGTTLCSGKAQLGGVQVFCPDHGDLEGLMET